MSARMDCGEGWRGSGAGAGVACACEISRQKRFDKAAGRYILISSLVKVCMLLQLDGDREVIKVTILTAALGVVRSDKIISASPYG